VNDRTSDGDHMVIIVIRVIVVVVEVLLGMGSRESAARRRR